MSGHTKGWNVDPCPDAQGFWTIRPADGTLNGDTVAQPIATVYDEEGDNARLIATAPDLAAFAEELAEYPCAMRGGVACLTYLDAEHYRCRACRARTLIARIRGFGS